MSPYVSKAQAAYFHIHKRELEAQGVNVNEWDKATKNFKSLPKHVKKTKKKVKKSKSKK